MCIFSGQTLVVLIVVNIFSVFTVVFLVVILFFLCVFPLWLYVFFNSPSIACYLFAADSIII